MGCNPTHPHPGNVFITDDGQVVLIDLGMVGHTRPAMQQNLLARVESKFLLFGYPGLAILCFTTAAAGSFWLVISIFFHDYKSRKKQMR